MGLNERRENVSRLPSANGTCVVAITCRTTSCINIKHLLGTDLWHASPWSNRVSPVYLTPDERLGIKWFKCFRLVNHVPRIIVYDDHAWNSQQWYYENVALHLWVKRKLKKFNYFLPVEFSHVQGIRRPRMTRRDERRRSPFVGIFVAAPKLAPLVSKRLQARNSFSHFGRAISVH